MLETGFATAITLANLLLLAFLFWKMPAWTRREIFFSVTVDAAFESSPEGVEILGRYRRRVALASIVLTAAVVGAAFGSFVLPALIVAPLLAIVVYFVFFLKARGEARPFAQTPSTVREASLSTERTPLPGGWIGQLGPLVVLLLAGVWLADRFADLPDEMVMHWKIDGTPTRVAEKSGWALAWPLGLGAVLSFLMTGLTLMLKDGTRLVHATGSGATHERLRRRRVLQLLLGVSYFCAVIFAVVTWMMTLQDGRQVQIAVILLTVLSSFGGLALLIWFLVKQPPQEAASPGDSPVGDRTEDRFWKLGLIYYNPEDPAIFVEKRFGIGYTCNMARPASWGLLVGIFALIFGILITVVILAP